MIICLDVGRIEGSLSGFGLQPGKNLSQRKLRGNDAYLTPGIVQVGHMKASILLRFLLDGLGSGCSSWK